MSHPLNELVAGVYSIDAEEKYQKLKKIAGEKVKSGSNGAIRNQHLLRCAAIGMRRVEVPAVTFNLARLLGVVDTYHEQRWRIRKVSDEDTWENYVRVTGVNFLEMIHWSHVPKLHVTIRSNSVLEEKPKWKHSDESPLDYDRNSIKLWEFGMVRTDMQLSKLLLSDTLTLAFGLYVRELSALAEITDRWDLTFEQFVESKYFGGKIRLQDTKPIWQFHDEHLRETYPAGLYTPVIDLSEVEYTGSNPINPITPEEDADRWIEQQEREFGWTYEDPEDVD